ncbi:MAG TPA: CHAP domain-containing protein [Acetobacteraceae bacterium]|nr:CHAP domain-containing protein [Acetobacteraceae bacterium]
MRRFPSLFGLLLTMALAACSGTSDLGRRAPLDCVPFARALSGINLHGDAAGWWWQADGLYSRGTLPEVGSVMVFAPAPGLPRGHVAVVSQVLSRREILVAQANWVHHRVTSDQLVVDVSPDSDWTLVRVWWPPSEALGSSAWPVQGFIYSENLTSHQRIKQNIPIAVHAALDD